MRRVTRKDKAFAPTGGIKFGQNLPIEVMLREDLSYPNKDRLQYHPLSVPTPNPDPAALHKKMAEYIYVASNPSMDGLVKVGKTTTSPSQRMVELHSTGVPTPFVIEFAAEVDDCHACEKAAHRVLAKYRLSSNREFFRTTVRHAIAEMLPVLGEYRLIDVRESHGIEKIESDLTRKREEIAAQERKRNAERAQQAQARTLKYRAELTAIQGQLAIARAKLAALGPQPVRPQAGSLAVLLFFCRLPIPPLGLAIWLGTLMIFKTELQTGGLVCLAILVASFLSRAHEKEKEQKYNMAARPFEPLEHEIGELEARIAAISVPSQAASAPTPANTVQSNSGAVVASMSKSRAALPEGQATEVKAIVPCPECGGRMRLPAYRRLDATCPHCRHVFRTIADSNFVDQSVRPVKEAEHVAVAVQATASEKKSLSPESALQKGIAPSRSADQGCKSGPNIERREEPVRPAQESLPANISTPVSTAMLIDRCIQQLARHGYKVSAKVGAWKITEPPGGRAEVRTLEDLIEYAQSKTRQTILAFDEHVQEVDKDSENVQLESGIKNLSALGYRVTKTGFGWTIREPLGGHVRATSAGQLIEYAASKLTQNREP